MYKLTSKETEHSPNIDSQIHDQLIFQREKSGLVEKGKYFLGNCAPFVYGILILQKGTSAHNISKNEENES